MTPKNDTISAIMDFNPSATASFLSEFSCDQLGAYLRRLRDRPIPPETCSRPRTPQSRERTMLPATSSDQ